jgi:lipopolysaccharide export system permease protein
MNSRHNGNVRACSAFVAGVSSMFPAPFGWHAKHMLAAYLRDTFLVMSIVLVVALSMDLAQYLGSVLAAAGDNSAFGSALFLGWYLAIRSIDRVAEFLPFAIFFGVYWAEIRQTISGERLIVLITGRAPLQCLAPLVWFSLLMGSLELALVVYLRPVAVMRQTTAHVGMYGERFNREPTSEKKWIATGNGLIQANIDYSSPALRDVQFFRMDSEHRVHEIIDASSATPINGDGIWLFHDGRQRTIRPIPSALSNASQLRSPPGLAETSNEVGFTSKAVALEIDPLWLRYFGIPPKFLPIEIFYALADVKFYPDNEYRTWAHGRISIPIAAGGMALLAGSLCLMLLANEIWLPAIFGIGLTGFAAHVLTTLFLAMGDHGWLHPALAAWLIPVLILLCPLAIHLWTKIRKSSGAARAQLYYSEKLAPR